MLWEGEREGETEWQEDARGGEEREGKSEREDLGGL